MRFIADTHSLLWYLEDSPRLSEASKTLFDRSGSSRQIVVPTIVLAELLYVLRKTSAVDRFSKILKFLESQPRFEIFPLTAAVLKEASSFMTLEMHDALIVATARHLDIPLMSRDEEIAESGMVKTIRP